MLNIDAMSRDVPTLCRLNHVVQLIDKEWIIHQLPFENVEVPRDHVPDTDLDTLPAARHDYHADIERRWPDTGVNQIELRTPGVVLQVDQQTQQQ